MKKDICLSYRLKYSVHYSTDSNDNVVKLMDCP